MVQISHANDIMFICPWITYFGQVSWNFSMKIGQGFMPDLFAEEHGKLALCLQKNSKRVYLWI